MFLAAVQIAGPLLVVLFLADAGLGLLTRVAPALNAFALGFPLKIFLTLTLGGLVFIVLPRVVSSLTGTACRPAVGGALNGRFDRERTEQATQKRMKEVRYKGQLSRSQDVTAWLGVGAAAVMLPLHHRQRASDAATDPAVHASAAMAAKPDPEQALQALGEGFGSVAGTPGADAGRGGRSSCWPAPRSRAASTSRSSRASSSSSTW